MVHDETRGNYTPLVPSEQVMGEGRPILSPMEGRACGCGSGASGVSLCQNNYNVTYSLGRPLASPTCTSE